MKGKEKKAIKWQQIAADQVRTVKAAREVEWRTEERMSRWMLFVKAVKPKKGTRKSVF
jgi:hypothetical protein